MSNFIRFPGMKPVNLDHILTFRVEDWDIRFIPANPNMDTILWRFKSHRDVLRVHEAIQQHQTFKLNIIHMDGHYED